MLLSLVRVTAIRRVHGGGWSPRDSKYHPFSAGGRSEQGGRGRKRKSRESRGPKKGSVDWLPMGLYFWKRPQLIPLGRAVACLRARASLLLRKPTKLSLSLGRRRRAERDWLTRLFSLQKFDVLTTARERESSTVYWPAEIRGAREETKGARVCAAIKSAWSLRARLFVHDDFSSAKVGFIDCLARLLMIGLIVSEISESGLLIAVAGKEKSFESVHSLINLL